MRHFILSVVCSNKAAVQRLWHMLAVLLVLVSNFSALVTPVQAKASASDSGIPAASNSKAVVPAAKPNRLNHNGTEKIYSAPAFTDPDPNTNDNKAEQPNAASKDVLPSATDPTLTLDYYTNSAGPCLM